MSLLSALNVGQSALATSQAAIQTTGNNIANASDPNYAREVTEVQPTGSTEYQTGEFIGNGVDVVGVQREVDNALNQRLNNSQSDYASASTQQQWLSQIESSFGALSGNDFSSTLGTFLNDWSTLANNPQDSGQRQVVITDGQNVAASATSLNSQLTSLQTEVNGDLQSATTSANQLASQIAQLNQQITSSTAPGGAANNSLLDQRDAALSQLSQFADIQTVASDNGQVDVYIGSQPLVVDGISNGLSTTSAGENGLNVTTVVFANNNGAVPLSGGQLGGLTAVQSQINSSITQVNSVVHNMISSVNSLHSSGQGTSGFTSVTGENAVNDPTAALNSATANLKFPPTNGSFVATVTDTATGQSTSTLVNVDLNGTGTDTTLDSLATSLSGIGGVTATVNAGKLTVAAANPGTQISFSQDTSGVLASLGINTFFTGSDATDIGVNSTLAADPSLLAAAKNGDPGDNQTALAIAALGNAPNTGLDGQTIDQAYQGAVNQVASAENNAQTQASAAQAIQTTLTNQQQQLSGVSIDEETVNLLSQQRAFQGASELITVVNQLLGDMMQMVN